MTPIRALVTGAGTGSSGNVIRALRAIAPRPHVVGVHHDRFTLKQSLADVAYLTPAYDTRAFIDATVDVVRRERINVVLPTDEDAVRALSDHRARVPIPLFLPRRPTIDLCQDKYALAAFLRTRQVPAPLTYEVRSLKDVDRIFARFPDDELLWCRVRRGSRSQGSIAVASPAQARSWISQWHRLRGVPVSAFTLSEYLPGGHFIVQSLWRDGRLVLVHSIEVLSYFAAGNNPSGVFSLSSLAKSVVTPHATTVSLDAVRAVEPRPSGTYIVELREAADGTPRVTEINAGRFPSGVTALLAVGKHNMVEVFAACALGDRVALDHEDNFLDERYLVRDIDALPGVHVAAELFHGIEDTAPRRAFGGRGLGKASRLQYKRRVRRHRSERCTPASKNRAEAQP